MKNMDKGRKYPKSPSIYLPNLSAQAQKFWISMEKGFIALGVRNLWSECYGM